MQNALVVVAKALQPDLFPKFSLANQRGETVTEKDLLGQPTILYAYPKDFTPGCTLESNDFSRLRSEFTALGYRIVGISPDSADRHARFCEKESLPFDLLADEDHSLLEALGAYGEKKNYGKVYQGVIRSTFLIDADAVIQKRWVNVKATGHAERILKELKA